ncbi:MAG: diphosphomevalonate decarboxylase [Candidatus Hodarchaeales archaeon]
MFYVKATAIANSNIALVKYWGKRDTNLILPHNSSVSMTLDSLNTKTTVEFDSSFRKNEVAINDSKVEGQELRRVSNHLNLLQYSLPEKMFAKVASVSNFPKAAGLASSASGFAALTYAGTKALNQNLSKKELSIFARQGSGSASRSVYGGFVEWNKGSRSDGLDSHAMLIKDVDHWPEISMIVTVISTEKKKISSRAGMSQTVSTSPFYHAWLETIETDVENMKKAIIEKNFTNLGTIAEKNALKMHATMHTTSPPNIYWKSGSLELMNKVFELREEGLECYFTMDAGPQVKILCLNSNIQHIQKEIGSIGNIKDQIICHPGEGARLVKDHLF